MANMNVSIKEASDQELDEIIRRLRREREAQGLVRDLKYGSEAESDTDYGQRKVSTTTPISSLYHYDENVDEFLAHYGVKGMKWGVRKAVDTAGNRIRTTAKYQANSLRNPFLTSRATRESMKTGSAGTQARRALVYQKTSEVADINKRVDRLRSEKAQAKIAKAAAKIDAKAKTKASKASSKTVNSGKNATSRLGSVMKLHANSLLHPIKTQKATTASIKSTKVNDSTGAALRRALVFQTTAEVNDINARVDKMRKK